MLIWFLAINFALAALYAVIRGSQRKEFGLAIFFLFLPGVGFFLYFLPGLLQAFLDKVGIDREAVLISAFDIERQPDHPDMQEALDVVPVEDAMAVSDAVEKRELLLKQLKKNLQENYRVLLVAEQDEDSEAAHYVAAAKMEIYRQWQARWLASRKDYEKDPDNPENYHTACDVLVGMLASGVISGREQSAYRKRLCKLVQRQIDAGPSLVSQKEYEEYLSALVELGCYAEAEQLWQGYANRMRSEAAYKDMLKMFYQMGERQKFEELLDDLCKNRQIRLSAKGLEQLRYWLNRLAGKAING